jgi:hypothetical protein
MNEWTRDTLASLTELKKLSQTHTCTEAQVTLTDSFERRAGKSHRPLMDSGKPVGRAVTHSLERIVQHKNDPGIPLGG